MQKSIFNKLGIGALWVVLISVLGVYIFYILYNAEWQLGDDAYMLRHTAFGIPFPISESILPEWGFFRPFDYLHENIVLLFHSGMHSAFEHYIINAVSFVLCMIALIGILWKTLKPQTIIDYAIIVLGTILVASRLIGVYINIFGPIFGVYTSHMLAIFFLCIFTEKDKTWAMILSIVCWVYSMLIYENVCMVLGCVGLFPLLFAYKQLNKKQLIYFCSLLGFVLVYILVYLIIIYLPSRGTSHYDPAHGTGVSLFQNAQNMLLGQKFIWVAALVWIWRQILLLRKKTTYHILYDTLLWAAGGMVAGAVVLRLNWTMYYYDAVILSLPAVVYFLLTSHEKYGKHLALFTMMLFAAIHSRNVPEIISHNQSEKIRTSTHMQFIADKAKNGWSIVWYEGNEDKTDDFTKTIQIWRKENVRPYMQYLLKNKNWDYDSDISEKAIVFINIEHFKRGDMPSICLCLERHEITSGTSYFIIE